MTMTLTSSFRRDAYAANAAAARVSLLRRRTYVRALVIIDLFVVSSSVAAGYLGRFQGSPTGTDIPYVPVGVGMVVLWMLVLTWTRSYGERILGYGADEYRRVVGASLKLAGAVAIACYLAEVQIARGFLGLSFLAGTIALPVGRYLVRQAQHHARSRGRGWSRRV